ncbi:hypothetical protein PybrP1_012487 [[Pythium] brassicae (nom. inval.)]|nr:hypothetical protein PybrP1_012487 [[Pythium] brassicae (nom. inval.)]
MAALRETEARECDAAELASQVRGLAATENETHSQQTAIELLERCKVFMRDRRGIDALLTVERFFILAESSATTPVAWKVNEEALKCAINSVFSRPDFVERHLLATSRLSRVLQLAKVCDHGRAVGAQLSAVASVSQLEWGGCEQRPGPASFHLLVWKLVLVSCEAPGTVAALCGSQEAWELLFSTLHFGINSSRIIALAAGGDHSALVLDLLKLLAVLANAMAWATQAEGAQPEIYDFVRRTGDLLLHALRESHPKLSALNPVLLEIKNRALEVFLFIPSRLLTACVCGDELQSGDATTPDSEPSALSALVKHLQAMLLATRVEKTRPISKILPILILCHNLTQTANASVSAFFRNAVLPVAAPHSTTADGSPDPRAVDDEATAFYFKHLTFFLTCLDSDVKRYAGEWIFLLCNENGTTRLQWH